MNMAYVFRRQWKSLPHTSRDVVSVMAPMNTHPQLLLVGGGACKGIVWSSIESFVYPSLPYSIDTRGKVLYTAHVDHKGHLRFPAEKYVYARLPLADLVDLVPLLGARNIAASHGIVPGS